MPELPEVETIARYLAPLLCGKRIVKMSVLSTRVLRDYKQPSKIVRQIQGSVIKEVSRRGKNIVLRLSSGDYLLMHLMMSGRLLWNPAAEDPHDRLIFFLSGGNRLVFNDARKFGRCRLVKSLEGIAGKEPLTMPFAELRGILATRKKAIKPLLMDQRLIAGIGNIYADEILWHAGIHPLRRASGLGSQEARAIWRAMRRVLASGIRRNGSSMSSYRLPDGGEGGYYAMRKAYRRAGEPCSRDGAVIQRIVVGQRSAHFCPKHQI